MGLGGLIKSEEMVRVGVEESEGEKRELPFTRSDEMGEKGKRRKGKSSSGAMSKRRELAELVGEFKVGLPK
jgi:hypothetical protein